MNANWHNVSRKEPCPICHKPDWCTVSNDGAVCVCRRVESAKPCKSGTGWIHWLMKNEELGMRNEELGMRNEWRGQRPHPSTLNPQLSTPNFSSLHASFDGDPYMQDGLALSLGLGFESFAALDVRYNHAKECMSFPMRDVDGNITGLRYRHLTTGKKWSERGSRDGLFFAPSTLNSQPSTHLIITEGPTDTAAAISMGLNAVGRSSCMSGVELIREFVRKRRVKSATIIADGDQPGWSGAKRLAAALPIPTTVTMPPPGYKDLRDWYRRGE